MVQIIAFSSRLRTAEIEFKIFVLKNLVSVQICLVSEKNLEDAV